MPQGMVGLRCLTCMEAKRQALKGTAGDPCRLEDAHRSIRGADGLPSEPRPGTVPAVPAAGTLQDSCPVTCMSTEVCTLVEEYR